MIEVVCGALIHDKKVMIAQRNYGSAKGKFEFPGGKVESGETLEEALIREWKEECGIIIENIQFLEESIDHQDGNTIHLTCFVCSSKRFQINLKYILSLSGLHQNIFMIITFLNLIRSL